MYVLTVQIDDYSVPLTSSGLLLLLKMPIQDWIVLPQSLRMPPTSWKLNGIANRGNFTKQVRTVSSQSRNVFSFLLQTLSPSKI